MKHIYLNKPVTADQLLSHIGVEFTALKDETKQYGYREIRLFKRGDIYKVLGVYKGLETQEVHITPIGCGSNVSEFVTVEKFNELFA